MKRFLAERFTILVILVDSKVYETCSGNCSSLKFEFADSLEYLHDKLRAYGNSDGNNDNRKVGSDSSDSRNQQPGMFIGGRGITLPKNRAANTGQKVRAKREPRIRAPSKPLLLIFS